MLKFFLRNHDWVNGIAEARDSLLAGKHRNDVIEQAINAIEDDRSIETVGPGGFPNFAGEMELDGAFMDGKGRMLGAIAAMKNIGRPVSVARKLMDVGLHTMLAGEGATEFALANGFTSSDILTPKMRQRWNLAVRPLHDEPGTIMEKVRGLNSFDLEDDLESRSSQAPFDSKDTALMIASDGNDISIGTSTSGWAGKHPGRVGDSPICGAGFYVDSRYGACGCTHMGEVAMRAATARLVVGAMSLGMPLSEAIAHAAKDLKTLSGGAGGGLVVHAVNQQGDYAVVSCNAGPVKFWFWNEKMPNPVLLDAEEWNH